MAEVAPDLPALTAPISELPVVPNASSSVPTSALVDLDTATQSPHAKLVPYTKGSTRGLVVDSLWTGATGPAWTDELETTEMLDLYITLIEKEYFGVHGNRYALSVC